MSIRGFRYSIATRLAVRSPVTRSSLLGLAITVTTAFGFVSRVVFVVAFLIPFTALALLLALLGFLALRFAPRPPSLEITGPLAFATRTVISRARAVTVAVTISITLVLVVILVAVITPSCLAPDLLFLALSLLVSLLVRLLLLFLVLLVMLLTLPLRAASCSHGIRPRLLRLPALLVALAVVLRGLRRRQLATVLDYHPLHRNWAVLPVSLNIRHLRDRCVAGF